MSTELSAVRTVNRICEILNCFTPERPALTLTEISNRLVLPRSTMHRLLTALESQGLLARAPGGRDYVLGYQLMRWGWLAQSGLDLRNEALPVLRELANSTGETTILSVRDGYDAICVEKVDSSRPVRLAMRAGQHLYLHAGASAKVLWAFLPDAEITEILSCIPMERLQSNTITDRLALRAELAAIRERGYATSFEETDSGAMGIAAPVFDHTGAVIAGVGMAAPMARVTLDRGPSHGAPGPFCQPTTLGTTRRVANLRA